MCGIIGYTGKKQAAPLLVSGLEQLEYRGYDSAGISVLDGARCTRVRTAGYVAGLKKAVESKHVHGTTGIAHTRWATHGPPTEKNAHPHTDTLEEFHVVHNGIIENHAALRAALPTGTQYSSDTDTEVIAYHLSHSYEKHHSVEKAFKDVLSLLTGSYGLAVVSVHEANRIYVAKQASPLIIGIGSGEMYICSDMTALVGKVQNALYMKDGEWGWVTPTDVSIFNKNGEPLQQELHPVPEATALTEKGIYKHYMQKEMNEAPRVIQSALEGRLMVGALTPTLPELKKVQEAWDACRHIRFIACGTSYHAALYGKYIIETIAHVPVTVEIASEFRYRTYLPDPTEVVIGISQSGETADTAAALALAHERKVPTIAIVNVESSTIARSVDACILLHAGPEMSVASTKACVGQSIVCALLALSKATHPNTAQSLSDALSKLAIHATETLEKSIDQAVIQQFKNAQTVFCLGRGGEYAVAMEAALKLKEVAYIHAEGYPGGELKHGSLALIDGHVSTLAFISEDETLRSKLVSNIAEVRSRGGKVVVVTSKRMDDIDACIYIPEVSVYVAPIIHTIVAHRIAYEVGCMQGTPIDKPRNLAKAVTVE